MQLSEVPLRITSLVTTLGALIGSVFYVRRVTVVEAELRRTWLLHNWHLRPAPCSEVKMQVGPQLQLDICNVF